eukprot:Filipodium_phascolosomae@DN829_c0_g1_i2.p1
MVMEYMHHELKVLLEEMKNPYSVAEIKCLLKQLLSATEYMHSHWIVHRDLKTSNLLLSNDGVLKVCDFGLARKFGDPIRPYTHMVVTLWYRPPELLLGVREYDSQIDMWSIGCIFGEMLLREPLFPGKGEMPQLAEIFKVIGTPTEETWPGISKLANWPQVSKIMREQVPRWRAKFPPTNYSGGATLTDCGLDLLQRLLDPNPVTRITATAALNHPYLTQELPTPQVKQHMPTYPETNNATNLKRRRKNRSLSDNQIKEREAFHQGDERYSLACRVDPEAYLRSLSKADAAIQKIQKNRAIKETRDARLARVKAAEAASTASCVSSSVTSTGGGAVDSVPPGPQMHLVASAAAAVAARSLSSSGGGGYAQGPPSAVQ